MKQWLPGIGIFVTISCLVSYFFELNIVTAPAIVAAAFLVGCFVHYPEERPGGIDNPDGALGNPLHLAAVVAAIIVLCFAVARSFPITTQLSLRDLIEL